MSCNQPGIFLNNPLIWIVIHNRDPNIYKTTLFLDRDPSICKMPPSQIRWQFSLPAHPPQHAAASTPPGGEALTSRLPHLISAARAGVRTRFAARALELTAWRGEHDEALLFKWSPTRRRCHGRLQCANHGCCFVCRRCQLRHRSQDQLDWLGSQRHQVHCSYQQNHATMTEPGRIGFFGFSLWDNLNQIHRHQ